MRMGKPLLKRLKIGSAFWKSFKEFLSKTYVHAYHYLADEDRKTPEKIMWMILHITMMTIAVNVVMIAWSRFTDNPTITTLESQHYSIYNIFFPAIAICSNNKLSKTKVEQYAAHLLKLNLPKQYRSQSRLIDLIAYMGRLYDSDIEGNDEFVKFQEVLDTLDSEKFTGIYNTRQKLHFLAPNCSDIVVKCKWGGQSYDCSEIIQTRRTNEGFCCTFNYVRPSNDSDNYEASARVAAGIGPDMGLTILLNLSSSDYFYPLKNFVGATALIFDPNEFADSATGFVREVPLEKFVETRITLSSSTKKAVEEVQRYSIEKRACMFKTDLLNEFLGNYVYGDCLVKCKLKSIMALCKCIPFNFPTNFNGIDASLPFCNLASISCMNKYKVKWGTFKPREFIKVLEREMEDSLSCDNCYPLCSSTTYIVDSTSAKLNFYYQNLGSVIAGMNESTDLSIVKVYFPETDSVLYKTDVLYAWYDIVSDYGGILGLFLGCSIISFFEILYFTTVRFYQNLMNSTSFMKNFQKQKPNVFDNKIMRGAKFEYMH